MPSILRFFCRINLFKTYIYYPHMPIGLCKVWIYPLQFVFFCTVTDFSGEDKASGVKFYTVVQGRPGQAISHFGELCSPKSPKSEESACGEWT